MKFIYLASRSPSVPVVKISLYNRPLSGSLDPSTGSGSVDPHQPSLKLWRGKQTFSRTTCPAKNMPPAFAGKEAL